jgi:TonB family C-terminal domain
MKYCPTCQTRYDEEIIRFCTKDGTPLVSEEEPNFVEMPSENLPEPEADADDPSEITVVRRNVSLPPPVPDDDMRFDEEEPAQRIVVPTTPEPMVRGGMSSGQRSYNPPPKSNTFMVVALTFLGTMVILGAAGIVFWMLQHERGTSNTNANSNQSNQNTNVNTMIDSNFNFNVNGNLGSNINSNANANANLKTPTPTPKPSPSVSPTPTETPINGNSANTNSAPPANTRPTLTITPTPPPSPSNRGTVNAGSLNGRALNLATPSYPPAARAMRASGPVTVQVMIDENGNVISAHAVNGNPLLRESAESAARRSKFAPVRLSGQPVRATGIVSYNFVSN